MEHNVTPGQPAPGEEAQRKSYRATAALWSQLRAQAHFEEHLFYEQLEAYVDGELDEADSSTVQRHLAHCPQCEARAQNLSVLRQELLGQEETAVLVIPVDDELGEMPQEVRDEVAVPITSAPTVRTAPQPPVRTGQLQEAKTQSPTSREAVTVRRETKSQPQS